MFPVFGRHYRVRAGGQSDGYKTHQRTVARFVGRVLLWRSHVNKTTYKFPAACGRVTFRKPISLPGIHHIPGLMTG